MYDLKAGCGLTSCILCVCHLANQPFWTGSYYSVVSPDSITWHRRASQAQKKAGLMQTQVIYSHRHGRGAGLYTVIDISAHSDITPTRRGTDVNLILALTTATYNNLQRHRWWYVWSPRPAQAPDLVEGPTTLHLCGVQVAPCPVKISFHCRCSFKVLAGALLDSDPGTVKCLTGCKEAASD